MWPKNHEMFNNYLGNKVSVFPLEKSPFPRAKSHSISITRTLSYFLLIKDAEYRVKQHHCKVYFILNVISCTYSIYHGKIFSSGWACLS